jgi:hypothetical protein
VVLSHSNCLEIWMVSGMGGSWCSDDVFRLKAPGGALLAPVPPVLTLKHNTTSGICPMVSGMVKQRLSLVSFIT